MEEEFEEIEVEVEVNSDGEEIETETETDESDTSDAATEEEEENSVPNRRPVDILDALYEDVEHELEESLSELDRRAQRRQARRAAGSKTPEPTQHRAHVRTHDATSAAAASSTSTPASNAAAAAPSAAATPAASRIRLNPFQRTKSVDRSRLRIAEIGAPSFAAAAASPIAAPSSEVSAASSVDRPLPLSSPPWLWDVATPFDPLWFPLHFDASRHEVNFAFGSNMNSARMVARKVAFEGGRGFTARLRGWQLCFTKTADSLGEKALIPGAIGYASLTPSADTSAFAYGVGYIVRRDQPGEPGGLSRLDEFEGTAQSMYARTKVTLQMQNGQAVEATAYLSCPGASAPYPSMLRPTRSYLNHLLCGSALLPTSYVEMLRAWDLSWMPDPVAHVAPEQALLVSEPTNVANLTEEQRRVVEGITKALDDKAQGQSLAHMQRALLYSPPMESPPAVQAPAAATAASAASASATDAVSPPPIVASSPGSSSSIAALRAKLAQQKGFSVHASAGGTGGARTPLIAVAAAPTSRAPSLAHATLHRASKRHSRRPRSAAFPTFQPLAQLPLNASALGELEYPSSNGDHRPSSTRDPAAPTQSNGATPSCSAVVSPRPSARLHPSAAAIAVMPTPASSCSSASAVAPASVIHALDSDSMPLVKPKPRGTADKEGLKRRMAKLQQHLQQQQEQIRAKMLAQQQMQAQATLSPLKPIPVTPSANSAPLA